ncbi:hypothetical protein OAN27_01970 [Pelagibacteraceae bacterium]|nr:hypothetical protein [Pelagibacteraceae bacterium]
MLLVAECDLLVKDRITINNKVIKDFLIISCTGKNDLIGLRVNNIFFKEKIQTNTKKNDELVSNIIKFLEKYDVIVDKNFSIVVNRGPGSFSSIRVSLSVAKGIQIAKGAKLYGYKDSNLSKFDAKNINLLIEKSLLESKLIKPIYLS